MPSPAYDKALQEAMAHHASSKTYSGKFLRPHKPFLTELSSRLGCTSALDYGCGKGAQYRWVDPADGRTIEQALGYEVFKYDPAWPPFSSLPAAGTAKSFDLVICTHVLGSIPITDLPEIIGELFAYARKAVFIAERIGPVGKKALSNVIGRPVGWHAVDWIEAIAPYRQYGVETWLMTRYETANKERFQGVWRL